MPSLHGGSLENKLAVPLNKNNSFVTVIEIQAFLLVKKIIYFRCDKLLTTRLVN